MPDGVTMAEVVTYVEQKFRDHDTGRHHDHDMVHVALDDRLERESDAVQARLDREGRAITDELKGLRSDLKGMSAQINRFLGIGGAVVVASPFIVNAVSHIWH